MARPRTILSPNVQKKISTLLTKGLSIDAIAERVGVTTRQVKNVRNDSLPTAKPSPAVAVADPKAGIKDLLRRVPSTLDELAKKFNLSRGKVLDLCDEIKSEGFNLHLFGEKYSIDSTPAPGVPIGDEEKYQFFSNQKGEYKFGLTSDNHLCSKYSRLDVVNDLYDRFQAAGVDRVYNAGNWIDGEARFNKHDLLVHGMHQQVMYFLEHYPQRKGITTYFVAGDDHEGWYAQREGIDIGAYVEMMAIKHGRHDLKYLGFMEAYIDLIHAKTGQSAKMLIAHPGGGSSYAVSYTSQKSVEAYDGGEKPAIAAYGHYHKLEYLYTRNVHAVQTGCTEDQTPFMRKKKLAAHIGGVLVECEQSAESGAIVEFTPRIRAYFNQSYYQNRWSLSGGVSQMKCK